MATPKLPDSPDEVKPKFLTEEQKHDAYSVESAMQHYKKNVYYQQRKGGNSWFHGRVSSNYRKGYEQIKWNPQS